MERRITASLGVAVLPDHTGHADGLIREADRAMYAAKTGGRNQTITATTSHELAPTTGSTDGTTFSVTGPLTGDESMVTEAPEAATPATR